MPASHPPRHLATDVVVVGGGPAGSATALMLRKHAPTLRVCLLEAGTYSEPRLGETLPPLARPLLRQLGIAEDFAAFCRSGGARQVHGTDIAWGSSRVHRESYLNHARGVGWHLDRRAFDAFLTEACAARGVAVRLGHRVRRVVATGEPEPSAWHHEKASETSAWHHEIRAWHPSEPSAWHPEKASGTSAWHPSEPSAWHPEKASETSTWHPSEVPKPSAWHPSEPSAWHLTCGNGTTVTCRFLVDAAGRSAPIARRLGAHHESRDRLVAFARYFDGVDGDPGLSVEAFEDGWWYTAGLPGQRLIAVCLSDADLARGLLLHADDGWRRAVEARATIARRLAGATPASPLIVRSAASRHLRPPPADSDDLPTWLAVGDAASVFDPLSSQGIVKSLRGGIFAAYSVADHLLRGDDRGLLRYRRFIDDEMTAFLETRARVYADESRWPDEPFWQRRRLAVHPSGRGH